MEPLMGDEITVKESRDSIQHEHHQALEEALQLHHHRPLETAQVDLFTVLRPSRVELEAQFHFVKKNSDGKLVVAQKSDRPEFGREILVGLDI